MEGAQHPSGAALAGLGRPGPASGRFPCPARRCPEAFRAGGAPEPVKPGAMGRGGHWVRAAHTALSAALALGLLLHRTGEAALGWAAGRGRPGPGRGRSAPRGRRGTGIAAGPCSPCGTRAVVAPRERGPGEPLLSLSSLAPRPLSAWSLPVSSSQIQDLFAEAREKNPGRFTRTCCSVFSGYLSDLQKQEERGELLQPLIFVLLVLCSILLYFKVSLMDPGFVKPEEEVKEGEDKGQGVVIPQVPGDVKLRRCGYCLVKQPMRAKHCQLCQHCVRRYDHHCPWLENCVGERNHPLFIVYLTVQLVVLLWGGHVAWSGLYFEQSREWLQHNIFLLVSFFLIFLFTIVVLLLLVSHLYLISCNTTTWEFMSHHRISYLRHSELENPFDQGIILNLWRFFCSRHLTAWENIYFHKNSEPV